MKWSRTLLSSTFCSRAGSRIHSRHMEQSIGLFTTASISSISKTLLGQIFTNFSDSSNVKELIRISGSSRYEAVLTGDHFACVFAIPFSANNSIFISWLGRNFAIKMSSYTAVIGFWKRAFWSPRGIQFRSRA